MLNPLFNKGNQRLEELLARSTSSTYPSLQGTYKRLGPIGLSAICGTASGDWRADGDQIDAGGGVGL